MKRIGSGTAGNLRRLLQSPASVLSAFFLVVSLCAANAFRASAASLPEQQPMAADDTADVAESLASLSPEEVLDRAIDNCRNLSSYQCRLTLHLTKDERVQNSKYVFYYKRPNLVRMHVENGKDKGSTVILRSDGRIRGRRDGLLSMFAVTLEPDDQRLYDLWNRSFSESDWVTLLTETKERLQLVNLSRVESVEGGKQILLYSEGADFVEETWLDSKRLVLLKKRGQRTNGDSFDARWSDIALNPAFEDSFFYF